VKKIGNKMELLAKELTKEKHLSADNVKSVVLEVIIEEYMRAND